MKKKYIPSEMEIIEFETEDIITESGAGEGAPPPDYLDNLSEQNG